MAFQVFALDEMFASVSDSSLFWRTVCRHDLINAAVQEYHGKTEHGGIVVEPTQMWQNNKPNVLILLLLGCANCDYHNLCFPLNCVRTSDQHSVNNISHQAVTLTLAVILRRCHNKNLSFYISQRLYLIQL